VEKAVRTRRIELRGTARMPKLISTKEAAAMLGTTEGTLKSWRSRGIGPAWVKLGAAVRYDVEELLDFIKRNTRVPSVRALVEDRRGAL
jgi:hypothetical protein